MIDANGIWYPNLAPKQIEVYNDTHQHLLLSGPRACGKTIVAVHWAVKHAWLYDNDRVGIFVKSTKTGKTGIWDDLLSYALPEWEEGLREDGFSIVASGIDGATRMHYVRITNVHGGQSEIQLHPLHHQDSVAEKLRGSRFGMVLFDEVDNYDNAEVFNVSTMQLRQIGLPEDKHKWVGTCNPAGDQEHWIYKKFWLDPYDTNLDESYRRTFNCYEFKLSDNPFLNKNTLVKLKETYRDDPEMYKRYVEGLWVPDQRMVHFAGAFRPNYHVIGDVSKGEVINPTDTCSEIKVGWDIGDRNHAVVFLENVSAGKGNYWTVLDEVIYAGEDISIEELTLEVMETMAALRQLNPEKKLHFKHWSDRSAFDRYRSAADAKDHILVNRYSNGDIQLIGCPKPPDSVRARIALVRQLLVADKLFVSSHCENIVSMFKKLAKGKTKGEHIKRNKHIHPFDAMSYVLYGELIDEIEMNMRPNVGERDWGVVSVTS